jgi:hypothetical protein
VVELGDRARCELAKALIESGSEGRIEVPLNAGVCRAILARHAEIVGRIEEGFSALAASLAELLA